MHNMSKARKGSVYLRFLVDFSVVLAGDGDSERAFAFEGVELRLLGLAGVVLRFLAGLAAGD
jgi:hypothetical protein